MTGPPASPEKAPWDTEALWEQVQKNTAREEPRQPQAKDAPAERDTDASARKADVRLPRRRASARPSSVRPFFVRRRVVTGVAALFIAALGALWLYGSSASAPEAKTFATQEGQRAVVRLTDGTRVHLNVDSRLTLLANFGAARRGVRLEGEAFFEVAKDSARPFVVHAGGATTRVLGTAFDVSAYPDDDGARVVVKEGRVVLRSDQPSPATQEVVLTRRQMGQLLRSGERVVRKGLDVSRHLAWTKGQLVFENAPFKEVARKLERWYGLTVVLKDTAAPPRGHLNARFAEDQPLSDVLSVVATAFHLEYERAPNRKNVTFAAVPEPSLTP